MFARIFCAKRTQSVGAYTMTSVGMHAVAARVRGRGGGTKLALQSGSGDGTTGVSPMHSAAPHPWDSSARVTAGAASASTAAGNTRSMVARMAPLPRTVGVFDVTTSVYARYSQSPRVLR